MKSGRMTITIDNGDVRAVLRGSQCRVAELVSQVIAVPGWGTGAVPLAETETAEPMLPGMAQSEPEPPAPKLAPENSPLDFIAAACEQHFQAFTPAAEFYGAYEAWCWARGARPLDRHALYQALGTILTEQGRPRFRRNRARRVGGRQCRTVDGLALRKPGELAIVRKLEAKAL